MNDARSSWRPDCRVRVRVSEPIRDGVVLEIRGPGGSPPYLVRWSNDGHVSLFFPAVGATIDKTLFGHAGAPSFHISIALIAAAVDAALARGRLRPATAKDSSRRALSLSFGA